MKIFRLNVDAVFNGDDNSPAIAEFIEQFSEALYAGIGSPPRLLKTLGVGSDLPLRCLVGIPEADFAPPLQVLIETYCNEFAGGGNAGLWTTERKWRPMNPGREAAPLGDCVFDTKWALSLGALRARWENEVLMSPDAFTCIGGHRYGRNVRHFLALAVYGFSDPWQFFTAK